MTKQPRTQCKSTTARDLRAHKKNWLAMTLLSLFISQRRIYGLCALMLLFALSRNAIAASGAGEAAEHSSAVAPVVVQSGPHGDYVVDDPYPQWVMSTMFTTSTVTKPCVEPKGLIPDWSAPLPVSPVRCVALNTDKTELWAATPKGLIYLDLAGRRKLYFAGRRWLPGDDVIAVGVAADGAAVAHTSAGDSIISRRIMTLNEKALYFDDIMQNRHVRMGMLTDAFLSTPGDASTAVLYDDDNDGQWTEMYLAAESFRYAVTRDPGALTNARAAFAAMRRLLTVSPVKGFPARSVLPAEKCPGRDSHNWRMLPSGDWCWKSDTSVDELVGHYFGLPIYFDLVADDSEKEIIRALITDMTDYIIKSGFRLVDEKGNPTTDGHWEPEWINSHGKLGDQGLNSLEALSALRSAYHITGNKNYRDHYVRLMKEHNYHRNAMRAKEISNRNQINHDSDEMAALSYYNLIRYEDDATLRNKYFLEGMRRLWEKDLPERNAEQIVIYGAFAKRDFRLDLAVRTLREVPLDLIKWSVKNGARADIAVDPKPDRFRRAQGKYVLPYTEAPTLRWSENMYVLDTDEAGRAEAFAIFWLLPYWMARYHAIIVPAPMKQ